MAIPEPSHDPFSEEDEWGEQPYIPHDSEAMEQIKAIMNGKGCHCALCHASVTEAVLVHFYDGEAALCCHVCKLIFMHSKGDV